MATKRLRYYHDFELVIDPVDNAPLDEQHRRTRFSVRVFDSPVGESAVPHGILIDDWGKVIDWLGKLAQRKISHLEFDQFSRYLGDLLLPDTQANSGSGSKFITARQLFFLSLQSLLSDDEGLRLRLRLPDELACMPWEFAALHRPYDDKDEREWNYLLGVDPAISIVRHEAIAGKQRKEFRFLGTRRAIFAFASPEHYDDINIKDEEELLKKELENIEAEFLSSTFLPDFVSSNNRYGASREMVKPYLVDKENPPDIYHFVGHGVWDECQGYIVLAKEDGKEDRISGTELAEWLCPPEPTIRLAILQSCNTAINKPITIGQQPINNVSIELLRGGLPAVIGMQHKIYSDCAALFAKTLYSYLIAGFTIDEAVTLGRIKVKQYQEELPEAERGGFPRDWGTPVLYLRNSGGNIFPVNFDQQANLEIPDAIQRDKTISGILRRWLRDDDSLADQEQVAALQQAGEELDVSALEILVLLRSALRNHQDAGYWTRLLRKRGMNFLVDIQSREIDPEKTLLDPVEKILGLGDVNKPMTGEDNLSWVAVHHKSKIVRQTATLALLAWNEEEAISRIHAALDKMHQYIRREFRRIELYGTIADALDRPIYFYKPVSGELESHRRQVGYFANLLIWGWRSAGYFAHNGVEIFFKVLYGALGSAIALAIYRAVLTYFNQNGWGNEFAVYSYLGLLFGFMMLTGMAITPPLLLLNSSDHLPITKKPVGRKRLLWLQVPLGAGGFCLASGIVVVFSTRGLTSATLGLHLVTAFIAGLILVWLGLYREFDAGSKSSKFNMGRYALRLSMMAILLGCIQLPVLWEKSNSPVAQFLSGPAHQWQVSPINLSATTIQDRYQVRGWMKTLINQCEPFTKDGKSCFEACSESYNFWTPLVFSDCFEQWLSILDTILVGIFLILGIRLGAYGAPLVSGNLKEQKL